MSNRGMGHFVIGSVAVFLSAATPAGVYAQALSGWDTIWTDEFDGTSVNTSRWEVAYRRDSPNNELQHYLPDQVTVSGGQLQITATDQWFDGKPYRSGLVRTWQEHRFGRWEVRADLPWGKGMWPAIWLLPRNADWPVGGEIDIMENIGSNPYFVKGSYHYNWNPGTPITNNGDYITGEDFAAGMHTYAVEWSPEQLRFYVDDNLYHTVYNPIQPDPKPMSLIINLAVGGDWPGSPDHTTVFPQTLDIDYARYWTRDEEELINPEFDRSGTSLNGWSTFGNDIGNVSAQSEASYTGSHSLKLFGQYSGSDNTSGATQGITVTEGQDVVLDARSYIRSLDSIAGTDNEVSMKLEFYSSFGAAYGSADFLGETTLTIADGTTAENAWIQHQITDVVPLGAVEARAAFVFHQSGSMGGSVYVDNVSLVATTPIIPGDINGDGFVGLLDLDLILGTWNATIDPSAAVDLNNDGFVGLDDLDIVLTNWNAGTPPSGLSNIPEPSSVFAIALAAPMLLRRSRALAHRA